MLADPWCPWCPTLRPQAAGSVLSARHGAERLQNAWNGGAVSLDEVGRGWGLGGRRLRVVTCQASIRHAAAAAPHGMLLLIRMLCSAPAWRLPC